jgi:GDPmannose 4,6-dehydratase
MQWLMLQQDEPEDYVIATGRHYPVRDFVVMAASELGLQLTFQGKGIEEMGIVSNVQGDSAPGVKHGNVIVRVDPRYFRPTEVESLLGDPSRAKEKLNWKPATSVDQLIREMVAHDLDQAKRHAVLKRNGFDVQVTRE